MNINNCDLCPRYCKVNRNITSGFCRAGALPKVNLYQLHYGEEPVLTGSQGSGTIFFSHCNLQCVYCQNYKISTLGHGKTISVEELAQNFLQLQKMKAHNINLVTPTHFAQPIKEALQLARESGLELPVIWNSNGYENVEILKEMEGLVDIYLPDFRYWEEEQAIAYSQSPNYRQTAQRAILEMQRQVGRLKIDEDLAYRGLLIRLLILPNNQNQIEQILEWIADSIGCDTYLSLMSQYYPTSLANDIPLLNRGITQKEYDTCLNKIENLGFQNVFIQELGLTPEWTPNFSDS